MIYNLIELENFHLETPSQWFFVHCKFSSNNEIVNRAKELHKVPLLVELARNASRKYISKKNTIKRLKRFRLILDQLPIDRLTRSTITFGTQTVSIDSKLRRPPLVPLVLLKMFLVAKPHLFKARLPPWMMAHVDSLICPCCVRHEITSVVIQGWILDPLTPPPSCGSVTVKTRHAHVNLRQKRFPLKSTPDIGIFIGNMRSQENSPRTS